GGTASGVHEVTEVPGFGIEGRVGDTLWRLGRAGWATGRDGGDGTASGTILARDGPECARFEFEDVVRPGAVGAIRSLKQSGIAVEMLSGDMDKACRDTAEKVGIGACASQLLPSGKVARIGGL